MFELDNFTAGEGSTVQEVYQRCILVSGKCNTTTACDNDEGHVVVETKDDADQPLFPEQRWPMCRGYFKALVLLSPGPNRIIISSAQDAACRTEILVRYMPLLHVPPLHLAIMVAKDSPLLIDCPPAKFSQVSSTHSSLDAAIAKFRITAYMWQALTAEDMRAKGLGRRSFRVEEEWTADTLSQRSLCSPTTGLVPKVHLIRTDKTVAELRNAQLAQQNHRAGQKDQLHSIFTEALQAHGAPFNSQSNPIVAGLILDSHYDLSTNLILAHAALGCHNPKGISLGMFGSHLTYAWPRFLEEVPDCLLDTTSPGDTVGNDNGECSSLWEACAVGQGAFLHEVGHALSAPHTSGIMQRGYSPDWPKAFLSRTAPSPIPGPPAPTNPVTPDTRHGCTWDVRDALRFRNLPHFKLPGDKPPSQDIPTVTAEEGEDGEENPFIEIRCPGGIGCVAFTSGDKDHQQPEQIDSESASIARPGRILRYWRKDLKDKYNDGKPLALEVTALNGKQTTVGNVWYLFKYKSYIRVPGTDIKLVKQSVGPASAEGDHDSWMWTVMLKKRDTKGKLVDASKIDLRVGCGLDGAIVYYKDGDKIPCGPRHEGDTDMGGHQARKMAIPSGEEIVKVAVTNANSSWGLSGLRMWLSNGKGRGALNIRTGGQVEMLVPPKGHKILGFYGTSGTWGMCRRFGIVTAPRDAVLPDSMYDMEELQNNPDPDSHRDKRRRLSVEKDDEQGQEDDDMAGEDREEEPGTSEDEDSDYDDRADPDMRRIYEK